MSHKETRSTAPLLVRSWMWVLAVVVSGVVLTGAVVSQLGIVAGLALFGIVWSVSRLWVDASNAADGNTVKDTSLH